MEDIIVNITLLTKNGEEEKQLLLSDLNSHGIENYFELDEKYRDVIVKIEIPKEIDTIDNYSFSHCGNLHQVIFNEGLKYINEGSFKDCPNLEIPIFPKSLEIVEYSAFYRQKPYKGTFKLLENVKYITPSSFGISDVEIDSKNAVLTQDEKEKYIFSNYNNESYLLWAPSDLKTFKVPSFIKYLINGIFTDFKNLEAVEISNNTEDISCSAFANCPILKTIKMADSVKKIYSAAFDSCTKLESITFPSKLETLGEYAFYLCTGIKTITIPKSVTSIGYEAFFGWKENQTIIIESRKSVKDNKNWDLGCNAKIIYLD